MLKEYGCDEAEDPVEPLIRDEGRYPIELNDTSVNQINQMSSVGLEIELLRNGLTQSVRDHGCDYGVQIEFQPRNLIERSRLGYDDWGGTNRQECLPRQFLLFPFSIPRFLHLFPEVDRVKDTGFNAVQGPHGVLALWAPVVADLQGQIRVAIRAGLERQRGVKLSFAARARSESITYHAEFRFPACGARFLKQHSRVEQMSHARPKDGDAALDLTECFEEWIAPADTDVLALLSCDHTCVRGRGAYKGFGDRCPVVLATE